MKRKPYYILKHSNNEIFKYYSLTNAIEDIKMFVKKNVAKIENLKLVYVEEDNTNDYLLNIGILGLVK